MKKKTLLFTIIISFLYLPISFAQIADGSIAPDFTLTDIDGNTHHLYDYLDAGKMVVLDFSATWCPPCWSYHNSGALENLYEQYGPDGTNEVMVFMIEADVGTDMNDLNGTDPASMGDWISGTPYPIIDLQSNGLSNDYGIGYFPTIFTICPSDYTVYESGQVPTASLYNWLQSCSLVAEFNNATDADCYGDGSATISVTGGLAPISYSWSDGSSSPDLSGVGGGTYSVTVTEANGRVVVLSDIDILGPTEDILVQNLNQNDVDCFGETTGLLSVAITGGTPGYDISWYSNDYPDINGSSNTFQGNLPAGFYNVIVVDNNDCTTEEIYEISQPPLLEVDIVNLIDETCFQSNGTIEISSLGGVGDYTVTLNGPNGLELTGSGTVFEDLEAGDYSIDVQDENNCITTISATIDFIDAPEVEVFSNTVLTCEEPSIVLQALISGGSDEFEYYWYTFNGNLLTPDYLETVTIDAPGIYFVEVLDFVSGCISENMVEIFNDQDLPVVQLQVGQMLDCETSSVTIDATQSSSGADISSVWSDSEGNILPASGYFLQVNQPGTYTFTLVNNSNGCTVSDQIVIMDEGVLIEPAFSTTTSELMASFEDLSTGGAINWQWDFGDGTSSVDQDPDHLFQMNGTFNVCLTASNTCGPETICQEVTVEETVTAILVNGTSSDVNCFGGTDGAIVMEISGGTGGYSYNWIGPAGFQSDQQNLNDLEQGSYVILVTDSDGNQFSFTIEVNQPDALGSSVTMLNQPSCFGETSGEIVADAFGGVPPYSYAWSNGMTASTISSLPAGNYACTITDANNCTYVSEQYTIDEPEEMDVHATMVNELSCNGASDGVIIIEVLGGVQPYTYSWNNGMTDGSISSLSAGSYSVTVTDANNCTFISEQYTIAEPLALSLNATMVNELSCNGASDGEIVIEVLGGVQPFTYNWSNGMTESSISSLSAGSYSVTIIDANNCTYVSEQYTITEPLALELNATMVNELSCFGGSDGEITLEVVGGVAPYTFEWNNGAISSSVSDLTAGVYVVTLTDANNCVYISEDFAINEPAAMALDILSIENASAAEASDGTIEITVAGGMPPYTYSWSNGATTESLQNLEPGIYIVEVIDANGCLFSSGEIEVSFAVSVNDPVLANAIKLAPNPAHNIVFLQWDLQEVPNLSVEIYNATGQVIKSLEVENAKTGNHRIDVSGWTKGLYFVSIRDQQKQTIKKLIIE